MDKTKIFYSSEIDYSKKTDEELVLSLIHI